MIYFPYQTLILIFQLVTIYFFSRMSINELFYFLRIFFKNERNVLMAITVFFLPGTILHEISHFFGATILMLKVREMSILPKREGNYVKLGSVLYEKKDFVRGILVGLAPFFFGMIFFWFLAKLNVFPNKNSIITLLIGYFIFVVSSTMFSSSKDLQDLLFVIPLGIIVAGLIYIFNIKIEFAINRSLLDTLENISGEINIFLFTSIIIHVCLIVFLKSLRWYIKK